LKKNLSLPTSQQLWKNLQKQEGSLHEFELIKDKNGKETIFTGYLFAKEGNIGDYSVTLSEDNPFIETNDQNFSLFGAIKNIQVGGERNYGFGWLELLPEDIKQRNKNIYGSGISIDLSNNLTLNTDDYLALAHVERGNSNLTDIRGDLEPLVGREWNSKGAGQKVSDAKICLTPGTKFNSESKNQNRVLWALE
jgi:hypothetical protein